MLKLHQIIKAKTKKIEPYGIWLKSNLTEETILVPITEIGWQRISHPNESITLDQEFEILIINSNAKENAYAGSIKRLLKNGNPYFDLAEHDKTLPLHGQVLNIYDNQVRILLDSPNIKNKHLDAFGLINNHDNSGPNELKTGDRIEVYLKELILGKSPAREFDAILTFSRKL